jgi:phenylalanine ammonia-lyase
MSKAFDIRTMQAEFEEELHEIVHEELLANFSSYISPSEAEPLLGQIFDVMLATLDTTTTMDAVDRMIKVAASSDTVIVRHFTLPGGPGVVALSGLPQFNEGVAQRAATSLTALRKAYLTGVRGSVPATAHLSKTRPVYEFVRKTLGIRMHGLENHQIFPEGLDIENATIGENVSLIYEVRALLLLLSWLHDLSLMLCRLFETVNCRVLL